MNLIIKNAPPPHGHNQSVSPPLNKVTCMKSFVPTDIRVPDIWISSLAFGWLRLWVVTKSCSTFKRSLQPQIRCPEVNERKPSVQDWALYANFIRPQPCQLTRMCGQRAVVKADRALFLKGSKYFILWEPIPKVGTYLHCSANFRNSFL